MRTLFAGLLIFLAVSTATAVDSNCPVKGPKIQWLADYCMRKVESDDIIAADSCMQEDQKNHYKSECEAKIKYKKEMCAMAIASGWVKQTPEQCFANPEFMGITVRNGGVGR